MRAMVLALMLSVSGPLSAQHLPQHVAQRRLPSEQGSQRPDERVLPEDVILSTLGAGLGGLAGFYAVGLIGYELSGGGDICGDDACGFVGGILGAVLGEAVGIGLGAHLGAGSRGSSAAPIGASLGVLIVAAMVAGAVELPEEAVVVVPVLQVMAAVGAALVQK